MLLPGRCSGSSPNSIDRCRLILSLVTANFVRPSYGVGRRVRRSSPRERSGIRARTGHPVKSQTRSPMKICSTAVRVTGVVVVALVVGVPASGQERLSVTPTSISVQAAQGETPPSQTVEISNDGNHALKWSVSGPSAPGSASRRGLACSAAQSLSALRQTCPRGRIRHRSLSRPRVLERDGQCAVDHRRDGSAAATAYSAAHRRPLARARAHGRRSRVRLVPSTSGPVSTSRALSMSMRARRRSVCAPACII